MSLQSRLADLITAIGADQKRYHGVLTTATTTTLTPAPTISQYNVTAQATSLAVAAPGGTPVDGQSLLIRIKDNGTARAVSWNTIFRAVGVTIPLTTVANKVLYVGAKYNAAETKWDVIAVGQEA